MSSCNYELFFSEISQHKFEKFQYVKFHEYFSSGKSVVQYGHTDRHTDVTVLIGALSDIAKAPKKWQYYKNLRKTKGSKEM